MAASVLAPPLADDMEEDSRLKLTGTFEEALAELDAREAYNDQCDRSGMQGCALAAVGGALAVFLLAAGPLSARPLPYIAVGLFLLGIARTFQSARRTRPRHRIPFLREVLTVLADDGRGPSSVDLTCDVDPIDYAHNQIACAPPQPVGGSVTRYRCAWLEGRLTLADGNTIRLALESTVTIKRTPKTKGRTREKRKARHKVDIRLTAHPRSYRGVRATETLSPSFRGGITTTSLDVAGRVIRFRGLSTTRQLSAISLLSALSALYSLLVPLKKPAKGGKSQATADSTNVP